MLSIKAILGSYLKSVRSFSEMVPWMGLNASDMVFNVDGSLMVVYEVAGIDAEGRLPIETDGYVENSERALKVFDEHILVWSIMTAAGLSSIRTRTFRRRSASTST